MQNDGQSGTGVQHEANIRLDRAYMEDYLRPLDAIVDEAIIRLTDGGIESAAVDPANVVMVEVEISNSGLSQRNRGNSEFGINTRMISEQVDRTNTAHVDLEYNADTRKFSIVSSQYRYNHSVINPDSLRNEPELPDLDLGFKATMDGDLLRDAVKWFDGFASHVRVGYDPSNQKFWMEADQRNRSGKIGSDDGVFEIDRDALSYVALNGHADSTFSLDYFRDIVHSVPEGYPVTIELGEEYPMNLSYEIAHEQTGAGEGTAHGNVKFMQAPRIQSD